MGSEETAARHLEMHGLGDAPRIADPARELYRAFELGQVALSDFVSPRVWLRSAAALAAGHGAGLPDGDVRQMSGAIVIRDGRLLAAFRPRSVADRPDYRALSAER